MNLLELSEQEIFRRNSMEQLRQMGIEPYPAAAYETHSFSQEIKESCQYDAGGYGSLLFACQTESSVAGFGGGERGEVVRRGVDLSAGNGPQTDLGSGVGGARKTVSVRTDRFRAFAPEVYAATAAVALRSHSRR